MISGLHAFVVRPFGTRLGVNFDAVERELIAPALDRLRVACRATGDILEAGNIRVDIFQRLLTADLVIADVSMHNANVFYELGIRHALRDRCTFMITCKVDDTPFDLRTDRYLAYDRTDPAASLPRLVAALRETLDSDRVDSPVCALLPSVPGQDRSRFLTVPAGFREDVRRAEQQQLIGDLVLLAHEAGGFPWALEGLRAAATALFRLGAHEPARITWEQVRELSRDDVEADARLATIYQKLGDLPRSDEALHRALRRPELERGERAEFHALLGSNAKQRWLDDWQPAASTGEQQATALGSGWLQKALAAYERAFAEDRNHYYSGLNALALRTAVLALAGAHPELWAACHESEEQAATQRKTAERERGKLALVVEGALEAAKRRQELDGQPDAWLDISAADFACLTCDRARYVAARYHAALTGAAATALEIVRRQLGWMLQLGVRKDGVLAAMAAVADLATKTGRHEEPAFARTLVFTGHMVDGPSRPCPRFPARAESAARSMIRAAVEHEVALASGGPMHGMAGASSGGDVLFHEVCAELGVRSEVLLAGSCADYVAASVAPAGPGWVERFDKLLEVLPYRLLGDALAMPRWLRSLEGYGIWQRNNLWTLFNAVARGPSRVTLIALWNGEGGDGPGGTADMVARAESLGAKVVILDAKKLLYD